MHGPSQVVDPSQFAWSDHGWRDVNARADTHGRTPLMCAAQNYQGAEIVKYLIVQNAAVDATDANGWTALMHAAAKGNGKNVTALLEAGAAVHLRSAKGETAIRLAAREDHEREVGC